MSIKANRVASGAVAALLVGLVTVVGTAGTAGAADHNHGSEGSGGSSGNSQPPAPPTSSLEPLANDCSESDLEPHNGFQEGPRCVSTAFGEVSEQSKNPSLLIVSAPKRVRVGEPFTLRVSTQNLVRDRFLAAGQGGYYLESAVLNEDGLTRGHFHTACRMIGRGTEALEPDRNAVFVATEDGGGGDEPDTVRVRIGAGLPERGTAQCAVWAGDGSHRIPMMQFANQIPAFDVVRIEVRR